MNALQDKRQSDPESQDLSQFELLKTSWKYQAKEFFNNSNLHGVRYIAEKDRPFHEKFIWFSFIVNGILVTLVIIWSLWEKFQTSPTITGLDTDFHKWDVPFPAITLCPQNPVDSKLLENYILERWGNLTDQRLEFYQNYVTNVANLSYETLNTMKKYEGQRDLYKDDLRVILTSVAIPCQDLLIDCEWKGDTVDCCSVFYPVLTDHGFCYTFNSKHYENDFLSLNVTTREDFRVKYIYETDNDLSLKFDVEDVEENPVSVFIHNFEEKIVSDLDPHYIWAKRVGKIMFSPKETYTTDEARQLSIRQRHCVFPDEIKLITDDIYTFGACMTQCRMDMAKKKCGCIPFFYPSISGYEHCTLEGLICLDRYRKEIMQGFECTCELSCMYTVYEIEKLEDSKKKTESDQLEVSFVSWPMIRYKRDVLFGWVDLFVAFGGIAGLFLGFSLLSAVETIYYFTLRAFCMVYREQNEVQKLHNEYENAVEPEIDLDMKPYFGTGSSPKNSTKNEIKVIPVLPYLP